VAALKITSAPPDETKVAAVQVAAVQVAAVQVAAVQVAAVQVAEVQVAAVQVSAIQVAAVLVHVPAVRLAEVERAVAQLASVHVATVEVTAVLEAAITVAAVQVVTLKYKGEVFILKPGGFKMLRNKACKHKRERTERAVRVIRSRLETIREQNYFDPFISKHSLLHSTHEHFRLAFSMERANSVTLKFT
jgi:hypothetical protein